jgi:hypothetical protein
MILTVSVIYVHHILSVFVDGNLPVVHLLIFSFTRAALRYSSSYNTDYFNSYTRTSEF